MGRVSGIEELENANIRMTELSAKIAKIILEDTVYLHMKEVDKFNNRIKDKHKQMTPYITPRSTSEVLDRIRSYSFDTEIVLADGITCKFLSTGHLSGASSILIEVRENEYNVERVLFSGDTSGTKPIPFTKPLDIKAMKINHIISEATYNDRLISKNNAEKELEEYIKETCIEKRGKIICPVFAVGRSSNMIYYLRRVYERNPQFKKIKVYLCSPMAVKAHKLLCEEDNFEFYDERWHEEIKLISRWSQIEYIDDFKYLQSKLVDKEPCIYLASAGMVKAYSEYIIGQLISHKNNRVVFCGYQVSGTKGELLQSGVQKSMTIEDIEGNKKSVPIRATISNIEGLSGHADYRELCGLWSSVEKKKLKNILLNHGNPNGMEFFKRELEKVLPNVNVRITKYNETIRLV